MSLTERAKVFIVFLAGAAVLASCGGAVVRRAELMASGQSRWFVPAPPSQRLVAPSPALPEPPPVLVAVAPPGARDPALALLSQGQQRQALLAAKREPDKLLEQFRAQELESWRRTPAAVSEQSEPLLLEEVLRLNLQEDSRLSPDLQRLLLATKSDLPLVLNERVVRYINYFLGRGRTTLRESLRRAGSYRPMISRILSDEGVPQDMIYLVQAESGFRPQARSRKRATGMWQFVAGRGREYGLNQTRHVDERLDPEKATRAAARHLADLYAQFGNWYLAMAAYNCGPGAVQRAVERTGYADYWELVRRGVLPRETTNYVPVILAMAMLGKNADAFHLDNVVPESPIDYDTVETYSRISLNLIADATGASVARIKQLNPALLGKTTPDGPYSLRVPRDTGERFLEEIEKIPEGRRQNWRRHEVRAGETLYQIARLYGVKPQEIAVLNQVSPEGRLDPGDRLTVPVPVKPEVIQARAVRPASAVPGRTRLVRYRVRPGDSLASIARRFQVTTAQLQQWNRLRGTHLQAGQILSVRVAQPAPGRVTVASRTAAAGVSSN